MSENMNATETLDMEHKGDNQVPNMSTLNDNTNLSSNVYKYVNQKVDKVL